LTEQFLQTAIDYAHAKEQIEEEHVLQAHEEYESALHQEDSLRQMADEKWAVEQLAREQEEFREGVTDYVHEQIKLAQEKEAYAKQEEDEALDSLHSLQEREVRLKKTLEDFRDLQKERQETRKQMEQRGGAEDDYVAQRQHWEEEQRQKTNRFDSRGPPSRQKVSPSNSHGGGDQKDIRRHEEHVPRGGPLPYSGGDGGDAHDIRRVEEQAAAPSRYDNQRDDYSGGGDMKDIRRNEEPQQASFAISEEEYPETDGGDVHDIYRIEEQQSGSLATSGHDNQRKGYEYPGGGDMKDIRRREEHQRASYASQYSSYSGGGDQKDIKRFDQRPTAATRYYQQQSRNYEEEDVLDTPETRSSKSTGQTFNDPTFRMDTINQEPKYTRAKRSPYNQQYQPYEDDDVDIPEARHSKSVGQTFNNPTFSLDTINQEPRYKAKRSPNQQQQHHNYEDDMEDIPEARHSKAVGQTFNNPTFSLDTINQEPRYKAKRSRDQPKDWGKDPYRQAGDDSKDIKRRAEPQGVQLASHFEPQEHSKYVSQGLNEPTFQMDGINQHYQSKAPPPPRVKPASYERTSPLDERSGYMNQYEEEEDGESYDDGYDDGSDNAGPARPPPRSWRANGPDGWNVSPE